MAKRVTPWNPNTADWLVKQRGKRTQDQVVADLAERGIAIKRAWLSRIENGAPFSADLLTAFEDYYGSVPPPHEPVEEPAGSDSALLDLASAIRDLVEELRLSRAGQVEATEVAFRALGALGRARPGTQNGSEHEDPVGTGR